MMRNFHKILFTILFLLPVILLLPTSINAQWVRLNNVNAWTIISDDHYIYAGLLDDIIEVGDTIRPCNVIRSSDGGTSWQNISINVNSLDVFSLAIKDSLLFAGTYDGIYVSSNKGDSWNQTSFDPWNGHVRCFLIDSSRIFIGTDAGDIRSMMDSAGGVFCSSDDGKTWESMNSGLHYPNDVGARVYALKYLGGDLYAGTWNQGIYKSTDHGLNWTLNETSNAGIVTSFAVIDSNLFAGTWYGSVFRTNDKGMTWIRCDSGLTDSVNHYDLSVNAIVSNDKSLFCGTCFYGVFLSTDYGKSWKTVNSGLKGGNFISCLAVIGNYLYAGMGDGIYRRPLSEMVSAVEFSSRDTPQFFKLEQNYPNPFNSSTIINYKLSKAGLVTVKVYDLLGREVCILLNERQNAGNHSVNFEGNGLSTGIYLYRLSSGAYTETKKMLMLR
jgi:photosystem II stability/assembly factor-like uncharacterized protein